MHDLTVNMSPTRVLSKLFLTKYYKKKKKNK
jgi:hypothetical protein